MITNAEIIRLLIEVTKAEHELRRRQDDESWEAWKSADAAYRAGADELIRGEESHA